MGTPIVVAMRKCIRVFVASGRSRLIQCCIVFGDPGKQDFALKHRPILKIKRETDPPTVVVLVPQTKLARVFGGISGSKHRPPLRGAIRRRYACFPMDAMALKCEVLT